jgi:hypothetical protein
MSADSMENNVGLRGFHELASAAVMTTEGVVATAAASKRLIGIMGPARVGKDTATSYLCDCYDMDSYAFADPIKDMLTGVFGDLFRDGDREAVIDWLGKSPRQLMQTLGTEWGRDVVHPDLWVLVADQMWKKYQEIGRGTGVVLSDVRFRNEAEWVLAQGGLLVNLTRPNTESVSSHVSEQAIPTDLSQHMISNDGSIYQLCRSLDLLVDPTNGR